MVGSAVDDNPTQESLDIEQRNQGKYRDISRLHMNASKQWNPLKSSQNVNAPEFIVRKNYKWQVLRQVFSQLIYDLRQFMIFTWYGSLGK